MQLEEQVAKLAYQFANLIDDKEIDKRWYDLLNREKWFNFAEVAIPIIQKAERERILGMIYPLLNTSEGAMRSGLIKINLTLKGE